MSAVRLQVAVPPEPCASLDHPDPRVLGFVNFGSLGIVTGGLGAMVPARRGEIVQLGLRAILSGTLATYMSGAVAGALLG